MPITKNFITAFLISLLTLSLTAGMAGAVAITDTTGAFTVGIAPNGELDDGAVGLQRNADGYDPIRPGTPREAWGVSAGGVSGWANHSFYGVNNIVANGAPVFNPNTAFVSSFLNNGGGNLLQIDQTFYFLNPNVLTIHNTITNVSGSAQMVRSSQNVDWDIAPSPFSETITVDPLSGFVTDATYYGFEDPDPLSPFSSSSGAAGGTFGPGDYGGGFQMDFGSLAAGSSVNFDIFHALNVTGQNEAALRAQLTALGATFMITGRDNGSAPTNFALVGVGTAVPEPATMLLMGIGLIGIAGARRRIK